MKFSAPADLIQTCFHYTFWINLDYIRGMFDSIISQYYLVNLVLLSLNVLIQDASWNS